MDLFDEKESTVKFHRTEDTPITLSTTLDNDDAVKVDFVIINI